MLTYRIKSQPESNPIPFFEKNLKFFFNNLNTNYDEIVEIIGAITLDPQANISVINFFEKNPDFIEPFVSDVISNRTQACSQLLIDVSTLSMDIHMMFSSSIVKHLTDFPVLLTSQLAECNPNLREQFQEIQYQPWLLNRDIPGGCLKFLVEFFPSLWESDMLVEVFLKAEPDTNLLYLSFIGDQKHPTFKMTQSQITRIGEIIKDSNDQDLRDTEKFSLYLYLYLLYLAVVNHQHEVSPEVVKKVLNLCVQPNQELSIAALQVILALPDSSRSENVFALACQVCDPIRKPEYREFSRFILGKISAYNEVLNYLYAFDPSLQLTEYEWKGGGFPFFPGVGELLKDIKPVEVRDDSHGVPVLGHIIHFFSKEANH